MKEVDFMRQVTDYAELRGYEWAHFRSGQTSKGWRTPVWGGLGAGWPDLMLVKYHSLHLWELKATDGKLKPSQKWVIPYLQENLMFPGSFITVYVFWPDQLGQIMGLLDA